ncbi:MAG TPA: branched-chain amino acid transaminase [Thermomicrobiales bacterium]|nr:branched-chain amino acid transaminase [Thermomicrobiales bacterium]
MQSTLLPYAYFDGRIVPIEEAKVSVATHALQYGTGVFGGIRGYLDQDGSTINIFRLPDHFRRFTQSAGLIKVRLPLPPAGLGDLAVELTRRNHPTGNVYFRPYAYKAGHDLGPTLTGIADGFALYMLPLDDYYGGEESHGLAVMVSSWQRLADSAIPARGKVSGAYVNSAIAKDEAQVYGFDDAILLNERGKVSEGSGCNLFMVRNGVVITPPVTANILEGITRRTLLQLARDAGIPTAERDIDRTELYIADELFFCGTGVQVTYIGQVDRRPVGAGALGPITRQLQTRFFDIVRGKAPEYAHWLTQVALPAPVHAD